MAMVGTFAWTPFDPWHLLLFGAVALLLFGKRLPEVGRSLGKGIAEFKKGLHDVSEELSRDDETPPRREKGRLREPPEDDELDADLRDEYEEERPQRSGKRDDRTQRRSEGYPEESDPDYHDSSDPYRQ